MQLDGQTFDVIIVGGGLAGNCLGLSLGDCGLKIAIVEANSTEQIANSAMGGRALALAAGTVQQLDNLGAWQGVKAKAAPIKTIHVSDRGHFGKARLSAKKEGVDALGYVITARDIELHLAKLVGQSGISRICPATLIGLMSGQDSVNISLKYQDQPVCLSARLLVAADGGQSTVRRLLEIPQTTTEYGQTALVTTVKSALSHCDVAYERFTESGPLALLPIEKNQLAVVWTRSHDEAQSLIAENDKVFEESLQDCFGYRLGKLKVIAPRRAFPVSLVRAEKMWSGRAVLIGNAAHQLHPVAGQGFNLGLRDVMQLADMLKKQWEEGGDIGNANCLSIYAKEREQDHRQTIGFTDSLVRLFSNANPALALARNIGLNALDHVPAAKSVLSRHAMGLAQLTLGGLEELR